MAIALAVERPTVVVFPDPQTARADAGDASIVGSRGFEPVSSAALRAGIERDEVAARDADRAALVAAAERLAAVDELYLDQAWEPMLEQLQAIEASGLAVLGRPAGCETLWQVQLRFALALRGRGATGDDTAARSRLRFAAALQPDKTPAPGMYDPAFSEAYASEKTLFDAAVRKPISVGLEPADAAFWVDCNRSSGPDVSLTSGLHVFAAGAPGFEVNASLVDTTTQAEVPLVLQPAPDRRLGAWAPGANPSAGPSWRQSILWEASRAGAGAVVWLAHDGEFAAQLLLPDARGRVHRADTRRGALEAALAELGDDGELVVTTRPTLAPASGPPVGETEADGEKPLARKWWFWTIIGGVAVAALGVGLGLGLRPDGAGPGRLRLNVR